MNEEQMKQWIDNASFQDLLQKNRFTAMGDPFFAGEMGKYFLAVMKGKREEMGPGEAVRASKAIGWE